MQEAQYIPGSIYYLRRRNETANTVIQRYAQRNRFMNVGVGIAGLFIPGGGLLAALASIATQAPLIYTPLVKELSFIYSAPPDMVTRGMITDTMLAESGNTVKNTLLLAFGPDFILELLQAMWPELGLGALSSVIPIVSAVVAAGLDATFAATLTWQIGTMTTMYFMNDEEWVISKKETRNRARKQTGLPSPNSTRPGVLNNILPNTPEISEKVLKGIEHSIRLMQKSNPKISSDAIRSILTGEGIDNPALIEEGLRRMSSHP